MESINSETKIILITSIGCAPASAIARTLFTTNTNCQSKYYIIGIDIQEECVGTFITDKYIKCPRITDVNYWDFIYNLIKEYKITHIFPTYNTEIVEWSRKKVYLENNLNCVVIVNDIELINIADNKLATYEWCCNNNINIPRIKLITERPIIIKPINGCGSNGIKILKKDEENNDSMEYINSNYIIQEFIKGTEYTIDIIADTNCKVINVIPKERLLIKNGQSFKSITRNDNELIDFATNCSILLGNKSVINIQVIRDNVGKIYLIEINPRFPTTIGLTIKSGVNIPVMLVEKDFETREFIDNLVMIRDYQEYFMIKD
jgi:carbamoyl-phosphate synthase large subunit